MARALNVLNALGVSNLDELCALSAADIRKCRGVGRTTLNRIIDRLHAYGGRELGTVQKKDQAHRELPGSRIANAQKATAAAFEYIELCEQAGLDPVDLLKTTISTITGRQDIPMSAEVRSIQKDRTSGLLDTTEAAKALNVGVRTLEAWRWRGQGPSFVRVGRAVRYRPEDISAFISKNTM